MAKKKQYPNYGVSEEFQKFSNNYNAGVSDDFSKFSESYHTKGLNDTIKTLFPNEEEEKKKKEQLNSALNKGGFGIKPEPSPFEKALPSFIANKDYKNPQISDSVKNAQEMQPNLAEKIGKGVVDTAKSINTNVLKPVASFGNGIEETLKISELRKRLQPEVYKQQQTISEQNPISNTVGKLYGAIAPMGATSKVAGKIVAPVGSKIASLVAQEALAGGLYGAVDAGVDTALGNAKPSDILKRASEFGSMGALGAGILGKGGEVLGKQIEKFGNNKALKQLNKSIEDGSIYDKYKTDKTMVNTPINEAPKINLEPLKTNDNINSPLENTEPLKMTQKERIAQRMQEQREEGQLLDFFNPKKQQPKLSPTLDNTIVKSKSSLTPEQESKLLELDNTYEKWTQNTKNDRFMDPQTKSKKLKGLGMKWSAQKREIIQGDSLIPVEGGLTSKELNAKIANLKTNYKGKDVIVDGKEGKIVGQSFGKHNVLFSDGTQGFFDSSKITSKINIDEVIAKQQQALSKQKNVGIEERSAVNVGNRSVESYQHQHPELKPYIQEYANYVKDFEFNPNARYNRTSAVMEKIKSDTGLTPKDVKDGLERLIKDNGAENTANAKRVELVIDDMLTNGFDSVTGESIPPIKNYINTKSNIEGKQFTPKEEPYLPMPGEKFNAQPQFETSGKFKESQVKTNSLTNAEYMQSPEAQKVVKDINANYEVKPREQTVSNAQKAMSINYDGSLQGLIQNGVKSAEENTMAGQYLRDLASQNRWEEYSQLVRRVRPDITNAAQLLESMKSWTPNSLEDYVMKAVKTVESAENVMKTANPAKYADKMNKVNLDVAKINSIVQKHSNLIGIDLQLFASKLEEAVKLPKGYLERVIKLAESGKYSTDELTQVIKEKYGVPSFSKSDTEEMGKYWNEFRTAREGSREQRAALYKLNQVIPNKMPNDWTDYVKAWRGINLFGNTKTAAKILGGNLLNTTVHNLKDALVRVPLDYAVSKFTGKRTALMPNLATQAKGFKNRFGEVVKDFKDNVNTDPFQNSMEVPAESVFKGKTMNTIDRGIKAGIRSVESPFKQGIYDDILAREMKLAKVEKPTQEMVDYAKNEAEKIMLSDNNKLTEGLYNIRKTVNSWTGNEKFGAGDLLAPILRTPANMALRAIEYSPISFFKPGKTQKEIIDNIAKGIVGTSFGVGGYAMAKNGMAYGSPDADKDVNAFNTEMGKQPFSFNTGNANITYDWAQPASIPFGFGAELGQTNKNKKPLSAALGTLFKQSFVQSLNTMLGGGKTSNPAENIGNALSNSVNQAVPFGSALFQLAKGKDDYKRETNGEVLKGIANKIPLLREQVLPPKINNEGKKIGENTWYNTFLTPANVREVSNNKQDLELSRLYEQGGEKKQFLNKMPEKKTIKKNTIEFSKNEVILMQEKLGNTLESKFNKVMNTSNYKKGSDEDKATLLANEIEKARKEIINKTLRSKGINPKTGR